MTTAVHAHSVASLATNFLNSCPWTCHLMILGVAMPAHYGCSCRTFEGAFGLLASVLETCLQPVCSSDLGLGPDKLDAATNKSYSTKKLLAGSAVAFTFSMMAI